MLRVPPCALGSTFHLFASATDAKSGNNPQGTGFLLAKSSGREQRARTIFAVANWHVAVSKGASVIRLHNVGGRPIVFDFHPSDWTFRDSWHDLAIICIPKYRIPREPGVCAIEDHVLLDKYKIKAMDIAPGEDVFVCESLVEASDVEANVSAVRLGTLRSMPTESSSENPEFCCTVPLRTKLSGSPIWVYRAIGKGLEGCESGARGEFLYLLGLHSALHSGDVASADEHITRHDVTNSVDDTHLGRAVVGIPAAAILELLEEPRLRVSHLINVAEAIMVNRLLDE